MPVLSGVLVADPCEFTATLGSESVTVVFDRAKMTLRRDRDMKRASANDDVDGLVKYLSDVLVSWDVVDESGVPVPLTDDVLLDVPGKVLEALIEGMGKAAAPASEEGNDSGSTSDTPTPDSLTAPESLQNGQQPSPSQTPSAVELKT